QLLALDVCLRDAFA
ncbi:DUF645 family protein, partial [Vibrio cholerae]